jgi:lysozyme
MVDLDRLKASLCRHEGDKAKPYRDTVGKLTIGVGHNLDAKGLSPAAREFILNEDILDAKRFLERELPWTLGLDDVRQRVFIELAFNMEGKLLGFKNMLRHAEAREWDLAADDLVDSVWTRQVGPSRSGALQSMLRTGKDPSDVWPAQALPVRR